MELELRGRGDIQLFRVEVPGPKITQATSRPTRRSACRCRARTSTSSPARATIRHWREAFESGTVKATGPAEILQADPAASSRSRKSAPAPGSSALDEPWRMPAEWAPHERTLMCWPARAEVWGERSLWPSPTTRRSRTRSPRSSRSLIDRASRAGRGGARRLLGGRRGGRDADRRLVGARLRPDLRARRTATGAAWTSASTPGARSSCPTTTTPSSPGACSSTWASRAATRRDLVLEGGSIAVDGEGTLITTEQCLLHPSRNPSLERDGDRGAAASRSSGSSGWSGSARACVEDTDTDGHVDNICAVDRAGPGAAADRVRRGQPQLRALRGERRIACARRASRSWSSQLLPYAARGRGRSLRQLLRLQRRRDRAGLRSGDRRRGAEPAARALPRPRGVPVPGRTLAHGGGGVHCITQQVPAV